jgi:hypothetical protein
LPPAQFGFSKSISQDTELKASSRSDCSAATWGSSFSKHALVSRSNLVHGFLQCIFYLTEYRSMQKNLRLLNEMQAIRRTLEQASLLRTEFPGPNGFGFANDKIAA